MMVWKHDCMKVQVPDQVLIRYEGVEVWNMKVWVLDQVPDQALLCVLRDGGHSCPIHPCPVSRRPCHMPVSHA